MQLHHVCWAMDGGGKKRTRCCPCHWPSLCVCEVPRCWKLSQFLAFEVSYPSSGQEHLSLSPASPLNSLCSRTDNPHPFFQNMLWTPQCQAGGRAAQLWKLPFSPEAEESRFLPLPCEGTALPSPFLRLATVFNPTSGLLRYSALRVGMKPFFSPFLLSGAGQFILPQPPDVCSSLYPVKPLIFSNWLPELVWLPFCTVNYIYYVFHDHY